jgi:hypothetical protein
MRGGRFDSQQQVPDRSRFTEGAQSVGSRTQPEASKRPNQTQKAAPPKKEERPKDTKAQGRQAPQKQQRSQAAEEKENQRESQRTNQAPRGRSEEFRQRKPSRDNSEFYKNNPNFIKVGKKKMNLYIFLMKRVFKETSHEEVTFSAVGEMPIMTALKAVETVTRVGYVTVHSIRTTNLKRQDETPIAMLKVVLKKTADFDRLNDEFISLISANARQPKKVEEAPPAKLPASEEEEVKSGSNTPPQINSCAGTQEDGSGASQKSDTSSSSAQVLQAPLPEKNLVQTSEEAAGKVTWWLDKVDREAMDSLQRQGFDLNEEPEIYI